MSYERNSEDELIIGGEKLPVELSIEPDELNTPSIIVEDRDEGQPDDLESLEDQEGKSATASEEALEKKPAKKNKVPLQKRFNQVYYEKKKAEELIEELQAEKEYLQSLVQEKSHSNVAYYEDSLNHKIDRIKTILRNSIEDHDVEGQVEAQEEYSRLLGERNEISSWKASQGFSQTGQPSQQVPQQPYQRRAPEPQLPHELQTWIEENPFMDPRSPDFDEEVSEEVTLYSKKLERQYEKEGKKADIGSSHYYDDLNAYIRENFDDGGEDVPQNYRPAMKSPSTSVASPSHTRSPISESSSSRQNVRLSTDEMTIAESMHFKHPNGRPYSKEESWRRYGLEKIKLGIK